MKKNIIIIILILALIAISGYLLWNNYGNYQVRQKEEGHIAKTTDEKGQLQKNFDDALVRLDTLSGANIKIQTQLNESQIEISILKANIRRLLNKGKLTEAERLPFHPKPSHNESPITEPTPAYKNKINRAPASEPTEAEENPSQGSVAYYCPLHMIEGIETYVTVEISKDSLARLINDLTLEMVQSTNTSREQVSQSIHGEALIIAKKMKVEIKVQQEDFTILDSDENLEKVFLSRSFFHSSRNLLQWNWVILPKRIGQSVNIIIKISGFNPENGQWVEVTTPKIIVVSVSIDPRNYWSIIKDFFYHHFEYLLTQILVPLITFFGGILVGRKRKIT
jgi:hypothetical protein